MDADAHRRAAQEDEDQIRHWQEQIALENRESDMRIQSYRTEIENHRRSKQDHLQTAAQLERDEDKRRKQLAALDLMARTNDEAA